MSIIATLIGAAATYGTQKLGDFYTDRESKTKVGKFLDNLFSSAGEQGTQAPISTQQQQNWQFQQSVGNLGVQNQSNVKDFWNKNKATIMVVTIVAAIIGAIAYFSKRRRFGRR